MKTYLCWNPACDDESDSIPVDATGPRDAAIGFAEWCWGWVSTRYDSLEVNVKDSETNEVTLWDAHLMSINFMAYSRKE